ncbi:hypothetical protein V2J09_020451 [Rumex salicifolius]
MVNIPVSNCLLDLVGMRSDVWRWVLGLIYIVAVAAIWIAASFVVQSVVDAGVSPFLITYICNSLFMVYIPIIEISRFLEDRAGTLCFWRKKKNDDNQGFNDSEEAILLRASGPSNNTNSVSSRQSEVDQESEELHQLEITCSDDPQMAKDPKRQLDAKGRWTRLRTAKVSLLVCPFWFLAQLTFNLSLKYTSVTSNTILSTASSLFTFLFAVVFLDENFTWVKLVSVVLCMGGTVVVSLGDSSSSTLSVLNSNPVLGDILALVSAGLYAVYITLIRKNLPDDNDDKSGKVSMAQFLGYLGLFNFIIFLPVAIVLNFTKLEPFYTLTWKQFGLVVGKGLLDNVLSDYLWAKAILLTTTTVATAGLTIQVPLAAVVDALTGNVPSLSDCIGAAIVMLGFAGINIPADVFSRKSKEIPGELVTNASGADDDDDTVPIQSGNIV